MNEEPLKLAMKAIEVDRAPAGGWVQRWYMNHLRLTGERVGAPYIEGARTTGTYQWAVAEVTCGTTMCLAGQIVHQDGRYDPVIHEGNLSGDSYASRNRETGEVHPTKEVAEEILGIDSALGYQLFEASDRIDDIGEFKRYITRHTGVQFD